MTLLNFNHFCLKSLIVKFISSLVFIYDKSLESFKKLMFLQEINNKVKKVEKSCFSCFGKTIFFSYFVKTVLKCFCIFYVATYPTFHEMLFIFYFQHIPKLMYSQR